MKIYTDKTKTVELNEEQCNLEFGELETITEIIHHERIDGREEEGHYEVLREYPNGGRDVGWVVDVPGIETQEAYDEVIEYQIYKRYSDAHITRLNLERQVKEFQDLLTQSDYHALKYAEGLYTEEEYSVIKEQRQSFRKNINILNEKIKALKIEEEKENTD